MVDYLRDPFLKNMIWAIGSPYGPLWTWLSYGLYHIFAGFGLISFIFGFKILGLLMHLFITVVVYRLAEIIATGSGSQAAILYGMNPLAIFELVANSHNDGPAILLLLISLYLSLRTRPLSSFFIAGIAASFKLAAGLAVPCLYRIVAKERGNRYAMMGIGIVATIVASIYLPFWHGVDPFHGLRVTLGGYISNSLPSLPYVLGYKQLIKPVHLLGMLAFFLWYTWLLQRLSRENRDALILATGLGFVSYFLLGAYVVQRWYYLWPLAVLVTVPDSPWTKAILGQSVLMLLSYTFYMAFGEGKINLSCTYLLAWMPIIILGVWQYRQHSSKLAKKSWSPSGLEINKGFQGFKSWLWSRL